MWKMIDNLEDVFEEIDASLILTEWEDYSKINWQSAAEKMRSPAWVFDSRSVVDQKNVFAAGLNFWRIGDGSGNKDL